MWLAVCPCGNRLRQRLMAPSPKSQVMFASACSRIGDFFVFWHSNFLRYDHFVEYMNMHAMNMWLTDAASVVAGADWTLHPWRRNNVGGGSLRARWWDTNLVYFSPLGDRTTYAIKVRHDIKRVLW